MQCPGDGDPSTCDPFACDQSATLTLCTVGQAFCGLTTCLRLRMRCLLWPRKWTRAGPTMCVPQVRCVSHRYVKCRTGSLRVAQVRRDRQPAGTGSPLGSKFKGVDAPWAWLLKFLAALPMLY